jgi:hypothetical protein
MYFILNLPQSWLSRLRFYTTPLLLPASREQWTGYDRVRLYPAPESFCYSIEMLPDAPVFRFSPFTAPQRQRTCLDFHYLPSSKTALAREGPSPHFTWRLSTSACTTGGFSGGEAFLWDFLSLLWFKHTCTTETLLSALRTSPPQSLVPVMHRAPFPPQLGRV